MHTYRVRLSPKPGTRTGNLTTEVRANSDSDARRIAESQFPGHRVEAIHLVS
jgi:hypothetical protein